MPLRWTLDEILRAGSDTLRWLALVAPVGGLIGSACALFLWLLDVATSLQWQHPWLLFLLPLGGVAVGGLYHLLGRSAEGGNNLVIEQIHEPGAGVPGRMGPLVLIGTVATHLFGGSAGREGTAVQMGGSIAGTVARWLQLPPEKMRLLLMAGVAAGFAGVFGTPIAGTVFAMEVLAVGRMRYDALIPCLIGAIAADAACTAWGIHHTVYQVAASVAVHPGHPLALFDGRLVAHVAVAAIAFGLASTLFAELMHALQQLFKRISPHPALRPAVGGLVVIALVFLLGTRDFLGLGVSSPDPLGVSIVSSFSAGGAHPWSWWWKTLFTAVTLGAGFKGGEVTPLFYIGAALGNTLATLFGAPVDLFAALGFVAVFAGATNAPLACTIMGIELFGATYGAYFAIACFLAYLLSGHSGIYSAQRLAVPKVAVVDLPDEISLGALRTLRTEGQANGNIDPPEVPAKEAVVAHPNLIATEAGQLCIYLTPGERRQTGWKGFFFGRPLYRELIDAAKADGLPNAIARQAQYGYHLKGRIEADMSDIPNPQLTICVELTGHREQLAEFSNKHGDWLDGKLIVFRPLEQWHVST